MNEKGLAVCQASNGLPVGNFEGGQKAEVTGFPFWVVIRSILENCQTVEEAVNWVMEVPIGYNMNLMLADQNNKIALVECLGGRKAVRILDDTTVDDHLIATNHTVLDELKPYEKMMIENSLIRYNTIEKMYNKYEKVTDEAVKAMLSTAYPEGLCCHFYSEFFGTLRSMVFDVTKQEISMTLGSPQTNTWRNFKVEPMVEQDISVVLPYDKVDQNFYNILSK